MKKVTNRADQVDEFYRSQARWLGLGFAVALIICVGLSVWFSLHH